MGLRVKICASVSLGALGIALLLLVTPPFMCKNETGGQERARWCRKHLVFPHRRLVVLERCIARRLCCADFALWGRRMCVVLRSDLTC